MEYKTAIRARWHHASVLLPAFSGARRPGPATRGLPVASPPSLCRSNTGAYSAPVRRGMCDSVGPRRHLASRGNTRPPATCLPGGVSTGCRARLHVAGPQLVLFGHQLVLLSPGAAAVPSPPASGLSSTCPPLVLSAPSSMLAGAQCPAHPSRVVVSLALQRLCSR